MESELLRDVHRCTLMGDVQKCPDTLKEKTLGKHIDILVGGFNPSEKYQSNWIISPSRGENKKYLKPPPR